MENEFVTYEIAKLLKELNFDEPCLAWYYFNEKNSSYALNSFKQDYGDKFDWWKYSELDSDVYVDHLMAPLWQQVINWLREKYNISVEPNFSFDTRSTGFKFNGIDGCIRYLDSGESNTTYLCEINNYYEARRLAILNALDKIKKV